MKDLPPFPIVLRSPGQNGFTFFRRINADLTLEQKQLGLEWQPHDPPTLVMPLDKYLYHMVNRVKWTIQTT